MEELKNLVQEFKERGSLFVAEICLITLAVAGVGFLVYVAALLQSIFFPL